MRDVSSLSSVRLYSMLSNVLAVLAIELPQFFGLLDAPAPVSCWSTGTDDMLEACRRFPHVPMFLVRDDHGTPVIWSRSTDVPVCHGSRVPVDLSNSSCCRSRSCRLIA